MPFSQTFNKFTYLDAFAIPRIEDLVEKIPRYTYFNSLDFLKSSCHQIAF